MSFIMRLTLALLIYFIVEFYFYKRFKNSIAKLFPNINKSRLKKIIRTIIIFTNLYPVILVIYFVYLMISGAERMSAIENSFFDWLLVYPFWTSVLIIVQSIVFLLPIDILRILAFPFYKKNREAVRRKISILTLFVIIAAIIYVPSRIAYDYNFVSTRVTTLNVENLPESLRGFKIALIADTQADWYTDEARLNNYIESVNDSNPDLVLIAGDIITSTPRYIQQGADAFKRLTAQYGAYTCVGDHDNWAYRSDHPRSLREISAALEFAGVEMVDNDRRVINVDSSTIGITFVTYTYSRRITQSDLEFLVNGNGKHDVDIFLTHQPNEYLIEITSKLGYDLFAAGHTHGGQLTLLFPYINLTPTLIETNYVKGDFYLNDMMIIVNRGLGMSVAPIRYNSTPEVTIIVLQNKE